MREYELEVLEQYGTEVKGTRRIRGAFFCDTVDGEMLLKETRMSEERAGLLHLTLSWLREQEGILTDVPVPSREGAFVVQARDGTRYMLRKWFSGKECDIKKESEILEAAGMLGRLHASLRKQEIPVKGTDGGARLMIGRNPQEEVGRKNQELKRIRTFIRKRPVKNEFEALYLKQFERIYGIAEQVRSCMALPAVQELYQRTVQQGRIIHGDFNYHNVLMCQNGPAVTSFEHMKIDIQTKELCYFLRKIMEKHRWRVRLGLETLRAYEAFCPLEEEDRTYLGLRLAYPEKFWKAAGGYFRSNKVRLPEKSLEKLEISVKQQEEKTLFLETIFSLNLQNPVV